MSKNEPNTITTPGASASRARSTQKVLDIQRRFIDASKVRFPILGKPYCFFQSLPGNSSQATAMRIAIFGTGGVGGYFGGRLAQAGEDVTFIARGEHLRAINANGLRVESRTGDFTIFPAKATDDVSAVGEVELVIVGVKAWQVPEAAREMKPLVGSKTTVVPMQNGVDAAAQLVSEFGAEHVIGGLCRTVSFVVGPGHIRDAGFKPSIIIGELDNRQSDRVVKIEQIFKHAGVEITIASDIQVALWTKFLFIASFSGIGAISNAPAEVIRSDPKWRGLMIKAMEEIYALAHARGIKLPPDSIDIVMAGVDALPEDATSSMQRDIAAGKPSELESQTGAVVRLAREAGVPVPTHELIYQTLSMPQTAIKSLESKR